MFYHGNWETYRKRSFQKTPKLRIDATSVWYVTVMDGPYPEPPESKPPQYAVSIHTPSPGDNRKSKIHIGTSRRHVVRRWIHQRIMLPQVFKGNSSPSTWGVEPSYPSCSPCRKTLELVPLPLNFGLHLIVEVFYQQYGIMRVTLTITPVTWAK